MIKNPRTGEWVLKNSQSTFFPDNWSESTVLARIQEAYINAVATDKIEGEKFTGRARGVLISGYIDSRGVIKTAYPVYGE